MKFFKVSMLISAFVFLWGVNSFVFEPKQTQEEIIPAVQDASTHLIPLMRVDGDLVKIKDLTESLEMCPH